jgi:hypothetical protein
MKPKGWYTGIVSVWDLPKEKVYVNLNSDIKYKIFAKLKYLFKNKHGIARNLHVNVDMVKNFFDRNHAASLKFIEKVIEVLKSHNITDFDKKDVEKEIKTIQTKTGKKIYDIKFPINFNSENGAILISMIFHDGGIEKTKLWPFYKNYEKEKINHIKTVFRELIGRAKIYEDKKNSEIHFPNVFGIILVFGLGLQAGAKVEVNPEVPEFIYSAEKSVKSAYLKQAFDDEGTIALGKSGIKEIKIGLSIDASNLSKRMREKIKKERLIEYAPNILKADQKLLESINIKVNPPRVVSEYLTKNKKIRQYWEITISSQENILNFYNNVGFYLSRKQRTLEIFLK